MNFSDDVLKNDEKTIMSLRTLYRRYGYTPYKMSKFEEYDLYVRNKSFLPAGNIIAFTGTGGRLLALKPDVTLSIVKNTKDTGCLQKFCYNENVYRVSRASREFAEIMQVGLECIGGIDVYSTGEVIMLADRSLDAISGRSSLDISHMGFLSALLDGMALSPEKARQVLRLISGKNVPGLERLCKDSGVPDIMAEKLAALAGLYGPFEDSIPLLREISVNDRTDRAVDELENVYRTVRLLGAGKNLYLDFSIVNDMNYYNGIIFQGFVEGIPTGILSGGRYDNLMRRFGRKSGAIGFAVCLDLLERLGGPPKPYDVDVLLLYDEKTDPAALARAVRALGSAGKSVRVQDGGETPVKYRQLARLRDEGLEILETND